MNVANTASTPTSARTGEARNSVPLERRKSRDVFSATFWRVQPLFGAVGKTVHKGRWAARARAQSQFLARN
eukprot:3167711-Prymnesium_polylepis.1